MVAAETSRKPQSMAESSAPSDSKAESSAPSDSMAESFARFDASNIACKQYIWGVRYIDSPICRLRDGDPAANPAVAPDGTVDETLYYLNDGNFNVTALIETDGTVAERYVYEPYGRVTCLEGDWSGDSDGMDKADGSADDGITSELCNNILYCGYRYAPETGLYHVRHRYHHPTLGRWTTPDPAGYVDGLNLYEYCGGGPAMAIDPMGLKGKEIKSKNELLKMLGKGEFNWSYTLWENKDKSRQIIASFNGKKVEGCEKGWICAKGKVELSHTRVLSKAEKAMVSGVNNFNALAVTVSSTATYTVRKWIKETYTVKRAVDTVKNKARSILDKVGGGGNGSSFDGVELGGGDYTTETKTRTVLNPEYKYDEWKKGIAGARAKLRKRIYGDLLTKMKSDPVTISHLLGDAKSVSVSAAIEDMRICVCPKAKTLVASVNKLSATFTAQVGQTERAARKVTAQAALVVESSGVWNVTEGGAEIGSIGKITMSFDLPGKWQVSSKVIELWNESMKVQAPKLWDKPKNMPKCTGR